MLKILEETSERKRGSIVLLCQCDCGKICKKSKLDIIDYSGEEFINHLLKHFPQFNTLQEAFDVGYQIDHIVPLNHVIILTDDQELQLKIAMDLINLRLVTAEENFIKNCKIDLPEVQEALVKLSHKYGFTIDSQA